MIEILMALAIVVSDGDTFSINGERFRPVGFDAPEIKYSKCVAERMFGMVAKNRFEELVRSPTLKIERRKCKTAGPRCRNGVALDRYRRTLARVFVNGEDVSDTMIREGYAIKYSQKFRGKWCER